MNRRIERKFFTTAAEAEKHAATSKIKGSYRFGTDSIVFTPKKESIKIEPTIGKSARGSREQRMEKRWTTDRYGVIDA